METVQLTRDEISLLENNISNSDFNQALKELLDTAAPTLHEYILNELSLRHTAWTGLISRENIDTVIVIETGLGATVVSLSAVFKRIYAVYLEADTMEFVKKRTSCSNISHFLLSDFYSHSIPGSDKALFVAYNDKSSYEFNKTCINIVNEKNIKYYYYINPVKLS
ncbi:MAG TPA: hypothetical protein ENJ08_01465, partial [Gammaproteobacteria bacterium]|nr:hypothetical protein [Gammaproteobacteria bacterium]